MAKEIERKWLVTDVNWKDYVKIKKIIYISQGYLFVNKQLQGRIRIANGDGFLTIKGPNTNCTRDEFEYKIPIKDAQQLMEMCSIALGKIRHIVVDQYKQQWEVDRYSGIHSKLITAEKELKSEKQKIKIPSWIGKEITGKRQYTNAFLAQKERDSEESLSTKRGAK